MLGRRTPSQESSSSIGSSTGKKAHLAHAYVSFHFHVVCSVFVGRLEYLFFFLFSSLHFETSFLWSVFAAARFCFLVRIWTIQTELDIYAVCAIAEERSFLLVAKMELSWSRSLLNKEIPSAWTFPRSKKKIKQQRQKHTEFFSRVRLDLRAAMLFALGTSFLGFFFLVEFKLWSSNDSSTSLSFLLSRARYIGGSHWGAFLDFHSDGRTTVECWKYQKNKNFMNISEKRRDVVWKSKNIFHFLFYDTFGCNKKKRVKFDCCPSRRGPVVERMDMMICLTCLFSYYSVFFHHLAHLIDNNNIYVLCVLFPFHSMTLQLTTWLFSTWFFFFSFLWRLKLVSEALFLIRYSLDSGGYVLFGINIEECMNLTWWTSALVGIVTRMLYACSAMLAGWRGHTWNVDRLAVLSGVFRLTDTSDEKAERYFSS